MGPTYNNQNGPGGPKKGRSVKITTPVPLSSSVWICHYIMYNWGPEKGFSKEPPALVSVSKISKSRIINLVRGTPRIFHFGGING